MYLQRAKKGHMSFHPILAWQKPSWCWYWFPFCTYKELCNLCLLVHFFHLVCGTLIFPSCWWSCVVLIYLCLEHHLFVQWSSMSSRSASRSHSLSSAGDGEINKWDRKKNEEWCVLMNKRCFPWGASVTRVGEWAGRGGRQEKKGSCPEANDINTASQPKSYCSRHRCPLNLLGQRRGRVSCSAEVSRCQQVFLLCISRSSRHRISAASWTQTNICGFYSLLT